MEHDIHAFFPIWRDPDLRDRSGTLEGRAVSLNSGKSSYQNDLPSCRQANSGQFAYLTTPAHLCPFQVSKLRRGEGLVQLAPSANFSFNIIPTDSQRTTKKLLLLEDERIYAPPCASSVFHLAETVHIAKSNTRSGNYRSQYSTSVPTGEKSAAHG